MQPGEHGLDHARERQSAPRVQHGGVAHLHVSYILFRRVLGQLIRNAGERVLGLHDPQGHVEGLEVLDQRAAVRAQVHLLAETVLVVGRKVDALLFGQIEDRAEAQGPVEVDVQIGLGELLDELQGNRLCHGREYHDSCRTWPRSYFASALIVENAPSMPST